MHEGSRRTILQAPWQGTLHFHCFSAEDVRSVSNNAAADGTALVG